MYSSRQPRLITFGPSKEVQSIFPLLISGQGTMIFPYTHSEAKRPHLFVPMVGSSGKELAVMRLCLM